MERGREGGTEGGREGGREGERGGRGGSARLRCIWGGGLRGSTFHQKFGNAVI